MKPKQIIVIFAVVGSFAVLAAGSYFIYKSKQEVPVAVTPAEPSAIPKEPETEPTVQTQQFSITEPTSVWVIANKTRPLPTGFAPSDLVQPAVSVNSQKSGEENTIRQVVEPDLKAMFTAADAAGIKLFMASGYRSEKLQAVYYNSYVARDGVDAANRYSAKPGTSEHQTGLALDISAVSRNCYLDQCFAQTPEGKWLAANAATYGFVLRYPDGKETETGYMFEPWHFRYVGTDLAKQVTANNQTLEAHFKLL